MASFTTLVKKVANAKSRQTTAFIRDGGTAWYNFGRVKNASISIEPVVGEKDVAGREMVQAFDITATFVMMQTSKDEIATLGSLAAPDGVTYPNGHFIFFSDQPKATMAAGANPTGDGFGFKNVLPKPSMNVQLNGEESMITIEFTGRVPVTAFDSFDTNAVITLDA